MPLRRAGRTAYNPVSTSPDANDDDDATNNNRNNNNNANRRDTSLQQTSSSTNDNTNTNVGGSQRASRRVVGSRSENVSMEAVSKEDTPLNSKSLIDGDTDTNDQNHVDDDDTSNANMSVIILDSAQKKFPIPCNSQWTIGKFKRVSSKIHKVPPLQQRLIFRGKMLTNDTQTLEEVKIDTDDVIIHLFPKPRVVVTSNDGSNVSDTSCATEQTTTAGGNNSDTDNGTSSGGAHIPSIVIDQEEQARRGQILVLGSVEIAESQNNVKMLSLLLLVICSMRLLALFSIALGVAEEPASGGDSHNSTHHSPDNSGGGSNSSYNDTTMEARVWQTSDFFDLAVSATGFYVATLGMKATQLNTLRLANAYMIGTIIAGIGWNAWNVFMYVMFYEQETAPSDDDDLPPLTRDDFITVAFFTVAMPLFVWGVCCARAWEFRRLIEEAEEEAAERIRSQLAMTVEEGEETGGTTSSQPLTSGRELTDLSASRAEIV